MIWAMEIYLHSDTLL
ncbi:UNVERIFIED_CONTAM: hypothetical protein GTU68_039750 [Idotea baltica]|nr:hypothetical protein [Idotea baltica]